MKIDRSLLTVAAVGVALVAGWSAVQTGGHDVAVLRTFNFNGLDRFTTLWWVDDGQFIWIRANDARSDWLADLKANPDVELSLRGRSSRYRANAREPADWRAYADARFRAKYGLADRWRSWRSASATVPVRLERRR